MIQTDSYRWTTGALYMFQLDDKILVPKLRPKPGMLNQFNEPNRLVKLRDLTIQLLQIKHQRARFNDKDIFNKNGAGLLR